MTYSQRWITPKVVPRRYDTYFYLVILPQDHELPGGVNWSGEEEGKPDDWEEQEITKRIWLTPSQALHENKTLNLAVPQYLILKLLESLPQLQNVQDWFRETEGRAEEALPIDQCLKAGPHGKMVLFPGDGEHPGQPGAPEDRFRIHLPFRNSSLKTSVEEFNLPILSTIQSILRGTTRSKL